MSTKIKIVCPHCKTLLIAHRFAAETIVTTWHCLEHGDVVPMNSAVCNPPAPRFYPAGVETLREGTPAERCDVAAPYASQGERG